jgi:hypothetical protein
MGILKNQKKTSAVQQLEGEGTVFGHCSWLMSLGIFSAFTNGSFYYLAVGLVMV